MKKAIKSKVEVAPRKEKRYFSETARRSIVEEVDGGMSKSEAARKYAVSQTSIYKWIEKYSRTYSPYLVKVIEHKSESDQTKRLKAELKSVYELLGRSQAENTFLNTVIELASGHYETDLKKNFDTKPSSVTIKKEKNSR